MPKLSTRWASPEDPIQTVPEALLLFVRLSVHVLLRNDVFMEGISLCGIDGRMEGTMSEVAYPLAPLPSSRTRIMRPRET